MKTIRQSYTILSPIGPVWDAFVEPSLIEKWGGGPAVMSDEEGFEFSLWGGDIYGKNTQIIKHKVIKQDWFSGKKWNSPSKLTFIFNDNSDVTTVDLVHEDVPDDDADSIAEGWKDYYLGPIKELIEKSVHRS